MDERRFSIRLCALLMTFMLLLGDTPALAASTALTTKSASLYKSASTGSKRLMSVSSGKTVSVISSKGSWKKVKVDGKVGFMAASAFKKGLVAAKPTLKPAKTPKPTKKPKATPKPKPTLKPKKAKKPKATPAPTPALLPILKEQPLSLEVQSKGLSMITQTSAKLYKKAKTSAKRTSVPKGALVTINSQNGKWSKVRYNGKTGYMLNTAFQVSIMQKSKMYQKTSTSSRSVTLTKGKKVSIIARSVDWIKVRYNKRTGYILPKALESASVEETPVPVPTQSASNNGTVPYKTLRSGSSGEAVKRLQVRLEELGFLDSIPDGKYRASTVAAVKLFQSAANIKKTGKANNKTQVLAYASSAPKSGIRTTSLKKGSKGTPVKRLQNRLKAKGYFKARINGKYSDSTVNAVKAFQSKVGISQDGRAGSMTLSRLFSEAAPAASDGLTVTPTPTEAPSATVKPTVKPTSAPKPPPVTAEKKRKANIVINAAMAQLGKPYVFGSTGMNSFDCSGFTMYAYKQVGISLPHSAYSQGYSCGIKVNYDQLARGDLVCWNTMSDGDLSDHVGIYLGNNQAIHASSGTGKVIISAINTGYYNRVFSWGRALF